MILGSIMSNMSSGISGVAAKGKNAAAEMDLRQLLGGKHEYNNSIDEHYANVKANGGKFAGMRAMAHKAIGNQMGSDYKGEGWKRTGVVSFRQAAGLATSVPLEAGIRYATGTGTLTRNEKGERDIAGIPFV